MADKSAIQWTDATWNPWMGCERVSPGCDNCYADREMTRYGRNFGAVSRAKDATFFAPMKWKEARHIFTCSWSDFFHNDADKWREEAWEVILNTPQHTYQILTKRPSRAVLWNKTHKYPPNVWLGTSVESSRYLYRIHELTNVASALRFVSAEPLLERIDLCFYLDEIDWVIVGGESGAQARPMSPEWARHIQKECQMANVAFFMKQMGSAYMGSPYKHGGNLEDLPPDLRVREFPQNVVPKGRFNLVSGG